MIKQLCVDDEGCLLMTYIQEGEVYADSVAHSAAMQLMFYYSSRAMSVPWKLSDCNTGISIL